MIGVYAIRHVATGRAYIGSSKNVAKRWTQHVGKLNRGTHHADDLQALWVASGGVDAFEFVLVETCAVAELPFREQAILDRETAALNGSLNVKTVSLDPRVAAKIGISLTGQKHTDARKANVGASRRGRKFGPHSEAHREKIRQASLKHRHSAESKEKIRLAWVERRKTPVSAETRAKNSAHSKAMHAARKERRQLGEAVAS